MGNEVSQSDVIINVLVQLLNVGIFFFFFVKFAGNAISKAIQEKIDKEKKLAQADVEYARLLQEAQNQKKELVDEALVHKSQLVAEARELAHQESEKILEQAQVDARLMIEKAQQEANLKERDLDAHFEQGVKSTAMAVVKKLFESDKDLKEEYMSSLVKEFTASYKK